jgi:hypothetical protein
MYTADWSPGLDGWSGNESWKTISGLLVNDGTGDAFIAPPFVSGVTDYSVETEIQFLRGSAFGLFARANSAPGGAYYAGVIGQGGSISTTEIPWWAHGPFRGFVHLSSHLALGSFGSTTQPQGEILASLEFEPGSQWHKYRLTVQGNRLRLSLNGTTALDVVDNRYLYGLYTGLWTRSTQINVRSFRVIAE